MFKHSGTNIGELKDLVQSNKMHYWDFTFPLLYRTATHIGFGGKCAKLTPSGMTYLLQTIGGGIDRNKAKALYLSDLAEFCGYVNSFARKTRKDTPLVIAYDQSDQVWGVMRRYQNMSNNDVLARLGGDTQQIERWRFTPIEMSLYARWKTENNITIGAVLRNGETGHTAFGYKLYLSMGDSYEFVAPIRSQARHLSNLPNAVKDLQEVLDEIKELQYMEFIQLSAEGIINMLLSKNKYDKIHADMVPYITKPLYKVMAYLFQQSQVRGYKVVCTSALDFINKFIMENLQ